MRFMNTWDITDARHQYENHMLLGPATRQLCILESWADSHSDGWAYWPKPARAAAKLMELIDPFLAQEEHACPSCWNHGRHAYRCPRPDVTKGALIKALATIKAFRTRVGADFEIVEV